MNPSDIGLPSKFTVFRKAQFDAAVNIAASDKRFVLDCMPTGAGKSLIYMAVHLMLGTRTMVLTANKALQRQLMEDFGGIGLTDIRGQSNYQCVALEHKKGFHGCDKGPCHFGGECELHPRHSAYHYGCEFYDQISRIRRSSLCVTNYDFWLAANRYMEENILGQFGLLILDEAHEAPDKLAEFCSVKLTVPECEDFLESGLPPVEDGTEAWVNWATDKQRALTAKLEYAKTFNSDNTDMIFEMTKVARKLEFLSTAHIWRRGEPSDPEVAIPGQANDWVGERTDQGEGALFSPVWAHRYAENWLFAGVPKVVMTSATILPQTAKYLGIADFDYREHQSTFPVSRRPIYLVETASISSKSTEGDLRAQSIKIDAIIGTRLDRKGVIQTHSYDRAYQVRMGSRHKDKMIWHKRGQVQRAVDQYRAAGPGNYLVSPAVEQGFDFPYDECEFQIVAKVPFPDTRSAVMRARIRSDKKYQNYLTAVNLIQLCGRGMRAEDDFCETFILDDNIFWFNSAARELIPKWFRAAYRRVASLPSPPPPMVRRPRRILTIDRLQSPVV